MSSPVQRRRALCIGVEETARHAPDLDHDDVPRFPSAGRRAQEMAACLEPLGYVCTVDLDPSSGELRREVLDTIAALEDTDLLIVHFIGHAQEDPHSGEPLLWGVDDDDGKPLSLTACMDVIERADRAPQTLFIIDTCHPIGSISRRFRPQARRVFLATATTDGPGPRRGAGLTWAVCDVLRSLRAARLHIDRSLTAVPVKTVFRSVAERLDSVERRRFAYSGSFAEVDEPPFFPNPAHSGFASSGVSRELHSLATLPDIEDVDPGLDVQHFLDRAAGTSVVAEHSRGVIGVFTGREQELQRLTEWLRGSQRLIVVTGAPGVGKSALLGLFVAASHPQLRDRSQTVWMRGEHIPSHPTEDLVAVHARQRGIAEICLSIGNQLGVADADSPEILLAELYRRSRPPVIVIDALDEIADHQDLMTRLLLPLIQSREPGGRPAGRVIVSARPLEDFEPLLRRARQDDNLIDLDDVPRETLRADLAEYVTALLRTTREFRHRGAVVNAFARAVAEELTAHRRRDWGSFLVAGLYTRWFAGTKASLTTDTPAEAERVGSDVPTDLLDVLELDLRSQERRAFWLRPALRALATTQGMGMPLSVLLRIVQVFEPTAERSSGPSEEELGQSMEAARFYLRSVSDTDGTELYRIFHQAVAEHLSAGSRASDPGRSSEILARMLAPLGPPDRRDWSVAEPYLLRHALRHATAAGRRADVLWDPGFLLNSPPQAVLAEAERENSTALPVTVWRALCDPALDRAERHLCAILEALRHDEASLAERLTTLPGAPALAWRPRWVRGNKGRPLRIVAVPERDGDVVVVLNHDGRIAAFAASTGARRRIPPPLERPFDAMRLIDLAGRTFVLLTSPDSSQTLWDAQAESVMDVAHHFDAALPSAYPAVPTAAEAVWDGGLVRIVGTRNGTVEIVDALSSVLRLDQRVFAAAPVTAVAAWDDSGELTVLAANDLGEIHSWRPHSSRPFQVMNLSAPVRSITVTVDTDLLVGLDEEIIVFRVVADVALGPAGGRPCDGEKTPVRARNRRAW